MKKINLTNIKNEKSISEVLFDALKPKAITNEQSKTVYALKLSVEREIEKREDGRNWAIRDLPLYLPEVDLHYQREPKNYEVAKITNNFNINKEKRLVATNYQSHLRPQTPVKSVYITTHERRN